MYERAIVILEQVLGDEHPTTRAGRSNYKEDLRALTPLIFSHVTPYGQFRLDLSERMPIEETLSA